MTNKAKTNNNATAIASMDLADAMNKCNEKKAAGLDGRRAIIKEVYKVSKADHILKAKIYVFYVNEIIKKGATLETALPFFKQEIFEMFESGDLKVAAADDSIDEAVDATAVYNNLRRLFIQAKNRYEKMKSPKGADQRDNEIKAKSFFDNTKLADIVEGFTLIQHNKKIKIIKELFLQLDPQIRLQLLLDLETAKEWPIPEIDEIK